MLSPPQNCSKTVCRTASRTPGMPIRTSQADRGMPKRTNQGWLNEAKSRCALRICASLLVAKAMAVLSKETVGGGSAGCSGVEGASADIGRPATWFWRPHQVGVRPSPSLAPHFRMRRTRWRTSARRSVRCQLPHICVAPSFGKLSPFRGIASGGRFRRPERPARRARSVCGEKPGGTRRTQEPATRGGWETRAAARKRPGRTAGFP